MPTFGTRRTAAATPRPGLIGRIMGFVKGDKKRTLKKASVANELVTALNALVGMRGDSGIVVIPAEAGFVITFTEEMKQKLGITPNVNPDGQVDPPTGLLKFRGVWSATANYRVNDVVLVIYDGSASTYPYYAGTFVCIADAPAGTARPTDYYSNSPVTVSETWAVLARGSWSGLSIASAALTNLIMDLTPSNIIATDNDGASTYDTFNLAIKGQKFTKLNSPGVSYSTASIGRLTGQDSTDAASPEVWLYDHGTGRTGGKVQIKASDAIKASDSSAVTISLRELTDHVDGTKKRIYVCSDSWTP